jgi:hypothetical protein
MAGSYASRGSEMREAAQRGEGREVTRTGGVPHEAVRGVLKQARAPAKKGALGTRGLTASEGKVHM